MDKDMDEFMTAHGKGLPAGQLQVLSDTEQEVTPSLALLPSGDRRVKECRCFKQNLVGAPRNYRCIPVLII